MLIAVKAKDSAVLGQFFEMFSKFSRADQAEICKIPCFNQSTFPMFVAEINNSDITKQFFTILAKMEKADQTEILRIVNKYGYTAPMLAFKNIKVADVLKQLLDIIKGLPTESLVGIFHPRLFHQNFKWNGTLVGVAQTGNIRDPHILCQLQAMDPCDEFNKSSLGQKFSQLPAESQTDEVYTALRTLYSQLPNDRMRAKLDSWVASQEELPSMATLREVCGILQKLETLPAAIDKLQNALLARANPEDCGPEVPNRGIVALTDLKNWMAAQEPFPSLEILQKATLMVEEAMAHTDTCVDALRTCVEGLAMNVKLLKVGDSDAPLSEKIATFGDPWLAGIRNTILGKLDATAQEKNLYGRYRTGDGHTIEVHSEVLELGLFFDNLHKRMAEQPDVGMTYAFCAKRQLAIFNKMLTPGLQNPLFAPYENFGALRADCRTKYASELAKLRDLCPVKYATPTETDPDHKTSISYDEMEAAAILVLRAKEKARVESPLVSTDMISEGSVSKLVGDANQISVADLPEEIDLDGITHRVKQEFIGLVSYIKNSVSAEHITLEDEPIDASSLTSEQKQGFSERKAELLPEIQAKLAKVESDPNVAKFGILSEICATLDIDTLLQNSPELYQRFGDFLSPKFALALQRGVLLQEANRYASQTVI